MPISYILYFKFMSRNVLHNSHSILQNVLEGSDSENVIFPIHGTRSDGAIVMLQLLGKIP
jgi:hypothetical protein